MATATTPPAGRWADAGRWVLLLHLVLSPLLFCTWTADAFEGPKAFLLTAAALVLAGLAASAWFARGAPLRPPARPDLATLGLILFVASAGLSTIFSISPLISWRGAADSHAGLQTLLAYLILYLSTRRLCRTADDGRRLLTGAVVGAALSSVYAVIQAVRLDPAAWDGVSAFADHARPFAMFGHANYLSAYLVMTAPLIALFLLRAAGRRRWTATLTLALIAVLAGAAVVAALSRGAWLAGGVALLVLGGGWFFAGRRRAALALAGLAVVAVVGVTCWWAVGSRDDGLSGRIAERLSRIGDGEGRWQIWRAAADLFCDRPISGWGTDTFQIVFGKHRPTDYAAAEWDITPTRAHNVALQILATQGLLGGAAAAVLVVGLALAVVRAWRRSAPDDRPMVVAVAAGLAAFLVQDLFGFTVIGCGSLFVTGAALLSRWGGPPSEAESAGGESPGLLGGLLTGGGLAVVLFLVNVGWTGAGAATALASTAVLAALAAWTAASGGVPLLAPLLVPKLCLGTHVGEAPLRVPREGRTRSGASPTCVPKQSLGTRGKAWNSAFCVLCVFVVNLLALYALVVRPIQAEIARGAGDRIVAAAPAEALACYERAADLDPNDDRGWTQLSAAAQLASRQAPAPDERRQRLDQARAALERTIALAPAAPYHHADLGRLLGEMAAFGLVPGDAAVAEWDAALAADPRNAVFLAEAARTALGVGRRDRARRWIARGMELYPQYALFYDQKGACALADGRLDEAAAALERALHSDWHGDEEDLTRALATYAAVQLERRQFESASQLAAEACRRAPDWPTARRLQARALAALSPSGSDP